jgi:hypothetical protein
MATLHVTFEITIPSDHKNIGSEAPELCEIMKNLGPHTKKRVVDPILEGFRHNFEVEGSAEGKWADLAEWTQNERKALEGRGGLVPGFGPEHPILQRFGDYRASWIDRSNEYHLEEWDAPHKIPLSAGRSYTLPIIEVHVGSTDPRVAKLSSGREEFDFNVEQEWHPEMWEEQTEAIDKSIPARPVHPIESEYENKLKSRLDQIYYFEAQRIPRKAWT